MNPRWMYFFGGKYEKNNICLTYNKTNINISKLTSENKKKIC